MFSGSLPRPLRLFLWILLALSAVSLVDAAIGYRRGGLIGMLYLWPPYPAFDFVDYTLQFPFLHTPRFFTLSVYPWYYPAPAIFVLYPFYVIAAHTSRVVGYAFFAVTAVVLDVLAVRRFQAELVRRGLQLGRARLLLWAVVLLGWPLYFGLQRGNIESLLWLGIAAALTFFVRRRYTAAAVLLGVVGSVKLYPLLYLALFLRPRKFREIGIGILTAAATTVAGLRFLEPSIRLAWDQVSLGIHRWTLSNLVSDDALGFDHSLFGAFRLVMHGRGVNAADVLPRYMIVAGTLTTAVFLLRMLRLPRPNQLLFIACATVLLPSSSYEYTLVGMLIPWAWLVLLCVDDARLGRDMRPWILPFALFAVTLAPLSFLHVHQGFFYFQGSVRAMFILALMVMAAVMPIPEAQQQPALA